MHWLTQGLKIVNFRWNQVSLWQHSILRETSFKICNLLLLLLSRFSHVQFCLTPETAAHQVPLSLGFCRQEHWSGLPFPSPMHEREKCNKVVQWCPTLSDPMDCSLPGSSAHGIFQARVREWVAIAFSIEICIRSAHFSHSVVSDSLQPHESQQTVDNS